jgi:hypothetical protein
MPAAFARNVPHRLENIVVFNPQRYCGASHGEEIVSISRAILRAIERRRAANKPYF